MCVGPLKPSSPAPPPPSPEVEAEKAIEMDKRKARVQERVQRRSQRVRGGTGRRSLITGSGGGMGYYNEYM